MPGHDRGIHRNTSGGRKPAVFVSKGLTHDLSAVPAPLWVDRRPRFLNLFHMSDDTEILQEIRDLLRLIAEPAIAERDKKFREALRVIGGSAASKTAKAILLLDGTKTQADIAKACGIDKGNLSGLLKKLKTAELLKDDSKRPQLVISIPANFFE